MSYIYEALSPGGHQEMLEEVFSKVREQVGSYKTASGSLVSFSDGADLPMPSFVCNIDAVQDLHGYDAPWVGGAGKNKLPNNLTTVTAFGVTYVTQEDGSIIANGTSTGWANAQIATNLLLKGGEQYILSGIPNVNGAYITIVKANGESGSWSSTYATPSITISFNEDTLVNVRLSASSGTVLNNAKYKPMIRLASVSDATFAPYSNICPISGHTGVNAWVSGVNVWDEEWKISGLYLTPQKGIPVVPNTEYRFVSPTSASINVTTESGAYIAYIGYYAPGSTFRTPSNCHYINFQISTNIYGSTYNNDISINYPSTDTEYHAYNSNSQTIQVSWQTEAGEVYGGEIDLVSGVLTVTHKSQTGFTRGSQDSSNKLYKIGTISDIKTYTNANVISPYFIDSMFEKLSVQGARAAETPSITHYIKALYVGGYIGKEAELDTLLESLQVKYELETPITYQLTPTQIKSLKDDITNAWCSTGDIKTQYQPNNIIAELRTEILALQARVEELE